MTRRNFRVYLNSQALKSSPRRKCHKRKKGNKNMTLKSTHLTVKYGLKESVFLLETNLCSSLDYPMSFQWSKLLYRFHLVIRRRLIECFKYLLKFKSGSFLFLRWRQDTNWIYFKIKHKISSLFKNASHVYTLLNLSPSFVPFLVVSLPFTFIQKTGSKV